MSIEQADFSVLLRIQKADCRKVVQKITKSIQKKAGLAETLPRHMFSFSSSKDICEVYELAAYLFVFEDFDLCYDVCCILDPVSFQGDYTLWSYVKACRFMKCAIDKMRGNEHEARKILEEVLPHENPELYGRAWKTTCARAQKLEEEYRKAVKGSGSPHYVRLRILGVAMTCNNYLQLRAFPAEESKMQEWINRIAAFMRAEEK